MRIYCVGKATKVGRFTYPSVHPIFKEVTKGFVNRLEEKRIVMLLCSLVNVWLVCSYSFFCHYFGSVSRAFVTRNWFKFGYLGINVGRLLAYLQV